MVRYIAFLRAINVAGQKLIKMDELARIFASAGFKNVRTYIQSGNVIFETAETNPVELTKKIETKLHKTLGYEVTVLLRPIIDLERTIKRDPFKRVKASPDVMRFVVFLSDEPKSKPKLPLISTKENLELFEIKDRAAFVLSRRKKNGRSGFPNAFVEKELGVAGTTRKWTTVRKIVDFVNTRDYNRVERKKR